MARIGVLFEIDPWAWLVDVLGRINDHPLNRLGQLAPADWAAKQGASVAGSLRNRRPRPSAPTLAPVPERIFGGVTRLASDTVERRDEVKVPRPAPRARTRAARARGGGCQRASPRSASSSVARR